MDADALAHENTLLKARLTEVEAALAEAPKGGPPGGPGGPGKPRLLIDPTRYAVLNSRLAALRGAYHNGEAVHYCQGEH